MLIKKDLLGLDVNMKILQAILVIVTLSIGFMIGTVLSSFIPCSSLDDLPYEKLIKPIGEM
jgi:hypothetical protein